MQRNVITTAFRKVNCGGEIIYMSDTEQSVVDLFTNTLGVQVLRENTDRCHRLDASTNPGNANLRSVIIIFTNYT